MAQQPMYSAVVNSPPTELAADITASATSVTVVSASALPPAPNLLTIGVDETAETVRYTNVSGNVLTVERAFQGVAKAWSTGAKVARYYTAYDHDTFVGNIQDVVTTLGTKETPEGAQAKADAALTAAKTDATTKANAAETNANQYTRTNGFILRSNPSSNANDYIDNGIYRIGDTSSLTNFPSGLSYAIMEVFKSQDYTVQRFTSVVNGITYQRVGTGVGGGSPNWRAWKKVLNQDDYDTLFQSVSSGKAGLATVIGNTSSTASFEQIKSQLVTEKQRLKNKLGLKGVDTTSMNVETSTMESMINAVDAIQTGGAVTGTGTLNSSGMYEVHGLPFTPSAVEVTFYDGNYNWMINVGGGMSRMYSNSSAGSSYNATSTNMSDGQLTFLSDGFKGRFNSTGSKSFSWKAYK